MRRGILGINRAAKRLQSPFYGIPVGQDDPSKEGVQWPMPWDNQLLDRPIVAQSYGGSIEGK
jgi:hypothetical protein